jgi:hypothetical protein
VKVCEYKEKEIIINKTAKRNFFIKCKMSIGV